MNTKRHEYDIYTGLVLLNPFIHAVLITIEHHATCTMIKHTVKKWNSYSITDWGLLPTSLA